ncbi:ABC transporter permease [Frankia nepalensis]|uniref:ABC transporter permease n=1 Tax=Frankia nepalensis TaxID=1836974 RepID=A0A937UNB9_9ACTN|nr:ABC transporter permease [Frankia nepalensis]MBL7499004.1 ABC transporter permease [Frankia nepalensis]MBL7516035.1 ABC transporter permease [Frankia nepalensis]MBL7626070.1 ABC transporter permease [Frankia nepalensis]
MASAPTRARSPRSAGAVAAALLAAVLLGGVLLSVAGSNPVDGYEALVTGAFGSRYGFGETLVRALPLALIALGVAPALRAGVFTIGAEGQLAVGALAATATAVGLGDGAPAVVLLPAAALAGALAGGAWAILPALLRVRAQVNEILSTLLLTYVALALVNYSLRTWLGTSTGDATLQSDPLPAAAMLPNLLTGTRLHWGVVAAPLAAAALAWWMRTPRGLAYEVLGANPALAARAGVRHGRAIVGAMVVAGAAAGLAGWLKVAGVDGTLYPSVSGGLGFNGVLVALLGGLRPAGILVAALVFGALGAGADGLQIDTGVPASLATVLQGLSLFFVAIGFEARRRRGKAA